MPFDSNGVFSLTPGYLAVTGETILPSNHNPPLEDIALQGLSNVLVRDGRAPMTGNLNMGGFKITNLLAGTATTDAVNKAQLDTLATSIQGYLFGLTLSNNATDPTNDIDIAAGVAASDAAIPVPMSRSTALTKRLDAAWAVGSGNGGLDTGSIANGTYHMWLIQRSDTGVVDALFSASATSPTMPANYDRKRRVGSIIRASGAILPFRQNGDYFTHSNAISDMTATVATASALRALTIPAGIVSRPILLLIINGTAASTNILVSLGDAAKGSADTAIQEINSGTSTAAYDRTTVDNFFSNTASQVYAAIVGTGTFSFSMRTCGWVDTRGQN